MRNMFKLMMALAALLTAVTVAKADTEYVLGPGDRLRVIVFGEDDLSGDLEIDGTGKISMPLIGSVSVGGGSPRDAERRVTDMLKQGYLVSPRVSIEVLNYRPFTIIGEVQKPGEYPYSAGLTVMGAVGKASGFTFRADENDITITRAGGGGATAATPTTVVQPGDVVRVKERYF